MVYDVITVPTPHILLRIHKRNIMAAAITLRQPVNVGYASILGNPFRTIASFPVLSSLHLIEGMSSGDLQ